MRVPGLYQSFTIGGGADTAAVPKIGEPSRAVDIGGSSPIMAVPLR